MSDTERRICCTVITEMLKVIPDSEVAFRSDLEINHTDAIYKAPEEVIQWQRTQHTLIKYMPKPIEEWQFKVASIFTTRSVESLKLEVEAFKNEQL